MDVDALKQAAIDAYMRSEDWKVHLDKDSGRYTQYGPGASGYLNRDGTGTSTIVIGVPGSAIPITSHTDLNYSGQFATIRERVDTALEDWQEDRLPKPESIDAGKQLALAAVTALKVGDTASFSGSLGGYLRTVFGSAPQFRGAAGDAFNNSFVNQLPATINNHGCLAAVVAEAWGAEWEIWTQARVDRDAVVEKATTAMKAYAESESASEIKFVLGLTGAALAGASAIVSGGATLPFALATAGITALSATNDYVGELEVERRGANYNELMEAFEGGLHDVDEGITKQEGLVRKGLENAWQVFENNRSLFDLTPRVSDDKDGDWGDETSLFDVQDGNGLDLEIPADSVGESLSSGLINAAHGIEDAGPKVVTGAEASFDRFGSGTREVGMQYNGVAIMMWIVADNNASSIRDLAWDVREGNAVFRAVIRDIEEADADSQANLNTVRERVAAGSGEDPWA